MENYALIMQEGGFCAAFGFFGERRVKSKEKMWTFFLMIFLECKVSDEFIVIEFNGCEYLSVQMSLAVSFSADIRQKFYLNFLSASLLFWRGWQILVFAEFREKKKVSAVKWRSR